MPLAQRFPKRLTAGEGGRTIVLYIATLVQATVSNCREFTAGSGGRAEHLFARLLPEILECVHLNIKKLSDLSAHLIYFVLTHV